MQVAKSFDEIFMRRAWDGTSNARRVDESTVISHEISQGLITRHSLIRPNGRRPPAATGTDPPHPCHCPGSRRRRTPHDRTPRAGTAQERTPSHVYEDCPGNQVFCIWQPCARDAGNKNAASAYGMGAGGLAVDAMAIGCLGVECSGRRFFVLTHLWR